MIKTKSRFLLFFLFLIFLTAGSYATGNTDIISTFLGEDGNDYGYAIAVDKDGYIYVAGEPSFDYGFIVKFSPDCSKVEYYSSFEGSLVVPRAIAVDESGRAYVVGGAGRGLPVTPDALYPDYGENGDGFLIIVDPDGAIEYCSYFGGENNEYATAIAVDKNNYIYITGRTESYYFPVFNAFYPSYNGEPEDDAFVMKFYPGGTALVYSTFLGGSKGDNGFGIAADLDGNAYVTGETRSSDFPVTSGPYGSYNGAYEVFVAKFDSLGLGLIYSTHLGGAGLDLGKAITVDREGNAYVTGFASGGFPVTRDAYDETPEVKWKIFVTKINPAGTSLVYSTFIGGSETDCAYAIAVDLDGNAYVTGHTCSSDFPVTSGAYNPVINNDNSDIFSRTLDTFLFKLSADGKRNLYSSYFGGSDNDLGYGIAVDGIGDVYFTGETESSDFPVSFGAYDETYNGLADAFVTKFFLSRLTSLIVSSTSGGTTGPSPGKDAYNYNKGTQAQIEAIPSSGYEFSHWTGDALSGYENDNPLIITMDSDKSVTANFKTLPPPKPDEPDGCFIATAAYGSLLHSHVDVLRDFRDKYLMSNKLGQWLIKLYYKYSPFVAEFIAKHETLKVVARIILIPLVAFGYLMTRFGPAITSAILVLIFLFPVLFVLLCQKKSTTLKEKK